MFFKDFKFFKYLILLILLTVNFNWMIDHEVIGHLGHILCEKFDCVLHINVIPLSFGATKSDNSSFIICGQK